MTKKSSTVKSVPKCPKSQSHALNPRCKQWPIHNHNVIYQEPSF